MDPGVDAFDFLGSDIGNVVVVSGQPDIVLENPNDAPAVGASVLYNVVYEVTDFRNATSKITRQVEVFATRPSIKSIPALADRYRTLIRIIYFKIGSSKSKLPMFADMI